MQDQRLDRFALPLRRSLSRRAAVGRVAGAGALAAAAGAGLDITRVFAQGTSPLAHQATSPEGAVMSQATPTADAPLTVVLVHGAFADASSWIGVVPLLQAAGVNVVAPANPLRGVSSDAAYIASVVSQIPGPVLLVGHSYGGVVITNAGLLAGNVVGLVYVAAFIPDEGESLQALAEQATDSKLGAALIPAQYPMGEGEEPGIELYIDPAVFHEVFCADLPAEQAPHMAVSQRPGAAIGFGEPTQNPAWKSLPTWAVVTPSDWTIGPAGERLMAERAGAQITEIEGSHVVMLSQPQAVTEVILAAVEAVS
jgi:pimeloyl-ACP methyl ester carboxylesterase